QRVFRHPGWVEQVVIAVRLHTYWNAKRIAAELRRREIAVVSHGWIEQLFDDLGAARPALPRQGGARYERSIPNSLWHIDIKGPFFIQLARERYPPTAWAPPPCPPPRRPTPRRRAPTWPSSTAPRCRGRGAADAPPRRAPGAPQCRRRRHR